MLLGRKAMTNLDSIFKGRDITLPTKVHIVKAMVFTVVMYRCEMDHKGCCCYCSVTQSWPTLPNPMDCNTPGLPIPHHLPEFAQVHVHCISDAFQPSSSDALSSCCLQSFPASGSFPISWFFTSGAQNITASASVLPMNIHNWFHLGLISLISLQSKGLSRVFSNSTVQKHQFFHAQLSL